MKLVAALAIVLIAFQISSANPTQLEEDLTDFNVKDVVNTFFKVLVKALNVTIDVADKLSDDYSKEPTLVIEDINEILLGIGNKAYNATISLVEKVLDQFENDLNAAGKKGIKCIKNQRENLNQVVDDGITNIVSCLAADVPSIIATSQDLVAAGKTTRDTLSKAQINLEQCKLGPLCLLQLPKDLKELPGELIADIKAALPIIKEIVKIALKDFPPCAKSNAADVYNKLVKVIDGAMDCIVQ